MIAASLVHDSGDVVWQLVYLMVAITPILYLYRCYDEGYSLANVDKVENSTRQTELIVQHRSEILCKEHSWF